METLGSLIKTRRNERGLSQQALANSCGTSDSEIAKISELSNSLQDSKRAWFSSSGIIESIWLPHRCGCQ